MQNKNQNPYAASQVSEPAAARQGISTQVVESFPPLPGGWLVVGLLMVVACLNYLDRNMVMTMQTSLKNAFSIKDTDFGLVTSYFLWAYGAFSPIGGYLADRFSKRLVILVSLFIWSGVTWWTGHVNSFNELLLARACMGISEACYIPAALALIADYHRGGTRSFATGLHMAGINLGGALGGLGGIIAQHYYWHTPFEVFGVIGVVYSIVLLFMLRNAPVQANTSAIELEKPSVSLIDAVKNLLSNPQFLLLFAFFGILGFAGWVLNKWMPTYFMESFGLDQATAGITVSMSLQGSAMVGVIIGGIWADHLSRTNPRGRIIVPVIGLTVASFFVLLSANTTFISLAMTGLIGYGIARIFCDANVMPILCQVADSRYRATGYGILNMFSCFCGGFGVYLGGKLRDKGISLSLVFNISAGIVLLCAFIVSRIKFATPADEKIV
jgi:MFS family permease